MSQKVDLTSWKPGMGNTGVVVFVDLEPGCGSRGRLASILHQLPIFMQSRLNLDGSRLHTDLCNLYDLVNDPGIRDYNSIRYLRYELQRLYPEVFGEAEELPQDFWREYQRDLRVLENHRAGQPLEEGFHALSCAEPFILEPEDWTQAEWQVLCKLCGIEATTTGRIRMNVDSLEVFTVKNVDPGDFKWEGAGL